MSRGLFTIALGASLMVSHASSAVAHEGHDDEDDHLVPVCVLLESEDPPEEWDVESLTAGLSDGSTIIVDVDPEECHGIEPAGEPASAEAVEAWGTISASVFADQLYWEEFVLDGGISLSEEEMRAVQTTLGEYVTLLEATGSHPCYEQLHGTLLESATTMDAAIDDLIAGQSNRGWIQLDDAFEGLIDYWYELEEGVCDA